MVCVDNIVNLYNGFISYLYCYPKLLIGLDGQQSRLYKNLLERIVTRLQIIQLLFYSLSLQQLSFFNVTKDNCL
jgi:hypothetical protein